MEKYIAGWDGGGTKTKCKIEFEDMSSPVEFISGAMNPNGSAPGVVENTIADLIGKMNGIPGGVDACEMLCVGAAGMSNPSTREYLSEILVRSGYDGRVIFCGDQETALYGALGGGEGIILISGTGSICYGKNDKGETARVGGCGCVMDDEGSGYAIGRDVLRAVVRSEDGREGATSLTGMVYEKLGISDVEGLIGWVYAKDTGKKEIASLSVIASTAAKDDDRAAKEIIQKAGRELSILVVTAARKLGLSSAMLVLAGSVLGNSQPVRDALKNELSVAHSKIKIVNGIGNAADGAVMMAKEALKGQ